MSYTIVLSLPCKAILDQPLLAVTIAGDGKACLVQSCSWKHEVCWEVELNLTGFHINPALHVGSIQQHQNMHQISGSMRQAAETTRPKPKSRKCRDSNYDSFVFWWSRSPLNCWEECWSWRSAAEEHIATALHINHALESGRGSAYIQCHMPSMTDEDCICCIRPLVMIRLAGIEGGS